MDWFHVKIKVNKIMKQRSNQKIVVLLGNIFKTIINKLVSIWEYTNVKEVNRKTNVYKNLV